MGVNFCRNCSCFLGCNTMLFGRQPPLSGYSRFLRNIALFVPNEMASHPSRQWFLQSLLWESHSRPDISYCHHILYLAVPLPSFPILCRILCMWFLLAGEQFRILVDKYLRQGLHKGVPPLFVDLRSLYKDPEKVEVIERLVLQYVDALQKIGKFSEEGN